ncbi:MAG TPA: dynamin family protein [Acidimicrobiales bacterium]|nr:dynamin family protein [Acidimicrobiales bacterium]
MVQAAPGTATDGRAVAGVVDLGIQAATAYGRPDLAARLTSLRQRLDRSEVHVFVIGDYKMGKSTMVNALVGTSVCPVDDGISTTVPTLVRHAPEPTAKAVFPPTEPDGDPVTREVPFADVADLVCEAGNAGNRQNIRLVEVGVPQPVLAGGLVVVDTPGVGGLSSPESAATLAAATGADAVIFATSAAQELTAPEVELLEAIAASCPRVVVALTKTDIYAAWRRIAELDRTHLANRRLDARVIPLSAELRLQALALGDAELNEESGFFELAAHLRDDVLGVVRRSIAVEGASAVDSVAQQIAATFQAERDALTNPEHLNELTRRLQDAQQRAERLRGSGSKWQQTLVDGIQDLTSDVDHDLRDRIRRLVAEADDAVEMTDPGKAFEDFATWLEQRLTADVLGNYALLTNRARALAGRVAEHFAEEEQELAFNLEALDPSRLVGDLEIGAGPDNKSGPFTQGLNALRTGYFTFFMLGAIGSLTGLAAVIPVVGVLAAAVGGKALKDERARMLTIRRQQAKQNMRKYIDEAQFRVSKDAQDTLRRVHRILRDTFMTRAQESLRSANEALQAAQQAAGTATADRDRRLRDIDAELKRLAEMRSHTAPLLRA